MSKYLINFAKTQLIKTIKKLKILFFILNQYLIPPLRKKFKYSFFFFLFNFFLK